MAAKKQKFQKDRPPDPHAIGAQWRLFVALPMPEATRRLIDRLLAALAPFELPVRWSATDSAHLTLHFLGETPAERAELLRLGLGAAVAQTEPFILRTGKLGVFPDMQEPRVIWLGLGGQTGKLTGLQRDLGRHLRSLGFPVEDRAFRPHITLGRARDTPPSGFGAAVERALSTTAVRDIVEEAEETIAVGNVLLMRSLLERGGARHVPIGEYPLGRSGRR